MKKLLILTVLFFTGRPIVFAQMAADSINYPTIGKTCPDVSLHHIRYFSKSGMKVSDFKGKWLILDFWNKSCVGCVVSFPRVNRESRAFQSNIQFMMVGIQDKENEIQPMYAKYRKLEGLSMACAFDSLLAKRWDIYSCPVIVVIDPAGIVRAITSYLPQAEIEELLKGNKPVLADYFFPNNQDKNVNHIIPYDADKPLLIHDNGGHDTDFMFRSVLTKWDVHANEYGPVNLADTGNIKNGRFQVLGADLTMLYNDAYFGHRYPSEHLDDSTYGKQYRYPILQLSDSSLFKTSIGKYENRFSYSLIMPPAQASVNTMEKAMQRDLKTYFGFDAHLETRKCPYWSLEASPDARIKLKTKGVSAVQENSNMHGKFVALNYKLNDFISLIRYYHQNEILFDDTEITGNVDLRLDVTGVALASMDDVNRILKQVGLKFVKKEKDMQVVVIRDTKTKND